jgi:predicted ATP-grasp superfamily ATP-dependent carboligase
VSGYPADNRSAGTEGTGRILITDAHWNKTVAAIRSLGGRGLAVTAGESTWLGAGLFSRYATRRIRYPSPRAEAEAFLRAVERELTDLRYDVLMPMELSTLLLLSRHRHRLENLVRFPFAADATLRSAASKWTAAKTAARIGVPVPRTRHVDGGSPPADLATDPGLPLVLKPEMGEGGRGLFYCWTRADLSRALGHIARGGADYVAQELIPGGGDALGVSMLMGPDGEVVAGFTHRRLREYPLCGGPSTLRESYRHPFAEECALRLLRAMDWQGVAMVEFKVDPRDGTPKLMEINPKFWGSLPLAIRSGVDFPYLLYRSAMGLAVRPPAPQPSGIQCRNLLPGDLLYFLARRGQVPGDFWRWKGTADDLLSLRDPGPVLGRLLSPLAFLYDPQLRAVLQHRENGGRNGGR